MSTTEEKHDGVDEPEPNKADETNDSPNIENTENIDDQNNIGTSKENNRNEANEENKKEDPPIKTVSTEPSWQTSMKATQAKEAQFYLPKYIGVNWSKKVKLVVFDFDKTITKLHTQGAVLFQQEATDEFITSNFADLEFFKFCVPFIKAQGATVGVASFGSHNEDAIMSGKVLIRKYLQVAFGIKRALDLFPDHVITFWHPSSKNKDEKKVGKEDHIAEIVKSLPKKPDASEIVLFDDDETNIHIAKKKGHRAFLCKALKKKDASKKDWDPIANPTGFNRKVWEDFVHRAGGGTKGCQIL